MYCSHAEAAGKRRRNETDSFTAYSALYCPPLKTIGTDVSVVPGQKTSLSHTVAAQSSK